MTLSEMHSAIQRPLKLTSGTPCRSTAALAAPGPTSTLYITNYLELGDGTVTGLDLVQGVNESSFPTGFPLGIDIAVYGDVRTMGYSENNQGEKFDLEDVRKDEECTDTVGVFLRVDAENRAHFRITLGPQVQTLTKAMTSILCKGLEGSTLNEIMELPADFVPKIVGGQLVRIRSQTVYYILTRMKSACKVLLNRQRAAQA